MSADSKPPAIVDTGASGGLTPYASDFVGPLQPTIPFIHGINGKVAAKGYGIACYVIQDPDTCKTITLLALAYH
eukprot:10607717-Ditylum_brightwellii.AAC.1